MSTPQQERIPFIYDDGGRAAAGYKGGAGDCVVRSIAIVAQLPYQQVYEVLSHECRTQRLGKRGRRKTSARDGVNTQRKWFKDYMRGLGFTFTALMHIGSGCKVHLAPGELPMGRLMVSVSRHYTAVIDGVIHDTFNPQRTIIYEDGHTAERCVYGYWKLS